MHRLTNQQILLILTLSERCGFIRNTSISNSNGIVFVGIHNADDVAPNQSEEAILDIFPGGTFMSTGIYENNDGSVSHNYRLAGVTSAYVTFYTKKAKEKAPTSIETPQEVTHPDCIIDLGKVESLLKPWTLEEIMRNEG